MFVHVFTFAQDSDNNDKDKKFILFPMGFYQPETGVGLGVISIMNHENPQPGLYSRTTLMLSGTARGQTFLNLKPLYYSHQRKVEWSGRVSGSYSPSRYHGREEVQLYDYEKYTDKHLHLSGMVGYEWTENSWVKIGFSKENRALFAEPESTQMKNEIQLLGENHELRGVLVSIERDSRDFPNSPRSGHWARLTHARWDLLRPELGVAPSVVSSIEADARFYQALKEGVVGALQIQGGQMSGEVIPFHQLHFVGGSSKLRGYYQGRFRDRAQIMTQAELRKEYSERWGSHAFLGVSRLGPEMGSLGSRATLASAGVGGFYFLDPLGRAKLKLDLGFSSTGFGVYFSMGDAF